MSYLKNAEILQRDYNWQITFEDYKGEECFKELLDKARSLRGTIIGVCMMKNYKSKEDEAAVNILDSIIGDRATPNTGSKS